ncbi:hypothetical protein ACFE04_019718 [Oxalis oulophora]
MGWETPVKKGVIRRPSSTKLLTVEADYVEDDWYNGNSFKSSSFSYDLEKLGTTQSEIPCLVFILERNTNMGQSNKERISRAKHLSPVFCSRRNHQPPANSLPILYQPLELEGKPLFAGEPLLQLSYGVFFLKEILGVSTARTLLGTRDRRKLCFGSRCASCHFSDQASEEATNSGRPGSEAGRKSGTLVVCLPVRLSVVAVGEALSKASLLFLIMI